MEPKPISDEAKTGKWVILYNSEWTEPVLGRWITDESNIGHYHGWDIGPDQDILEADDPTHYCEIPQALNLK